MSTKGQHYKWSEEAKQKITGRKMPKGCRWPKGHHPINEFKIGNIPWNRGKTGLHWRKFSQETCQKMREAHKGKGVGENNGMWRGGASFEPYPPTFNQQLKDKIRVRDNFICQVCGIPELECQRRLAIHHIDYNKNNCEEVNLKSLCNKCNGKVNVNREYWNEYFKKKVLKQ